MSHQGLCSASTRFSTRAGGTHGGMLCWAKGAETGESGPVNGHRGRENLTSL